MASYIDHIFYKVYNHEKYQYCPVFDRSPCNAYSDACFRCNLVIEQHFAMKILHRNVVSDLGILLVFISSFRMLNIALNFLF